MENGGKKFRKRWPFEVEIFGVFGAARLAWFCALRSGWWWLFQTNEQRTGGAHVMT